MTIPDNQPEYHNHQGIEFPNNPVGKFLQDPGEEPQWVEVGHLCPVCGLTYSPAAIRMRLEFEMGWATTQEDVGEDVEDCS